jgi:hypothetical protein
MIVVQPWGLAVPTVIAIVSASAGARWASMRSGWGLYRPPTRCAETSPARTGDFTDLRVGMASPNSSSEDFTDRGEDFTD